MNYSLFNIVTFVKKFRKEQNGMNQRKIAFIIVRQIQLGKNLK